MKVIFVKWLRRQRGKYPALLQRAMKYGFIVASLYLDFYFLLIIRIRLAIV